MPDDPDGKERRLSDAVCRRVTVADFPIDSAEYLLQATIYSPHSLSLASKPLVVRAVLDQVDAPCAWVDADMEFYGPLDDLAIVLGDAELAITPHLTGAHRAAEPALSDRTLLIAGAFNAGFVAVSTRGRPFLDWWEQRCRRDCLLDAQHNLYYDQRWLDLATAQFPCRVIRDPGYNVAYWNVAERGLTLDDGEYRVSGAPLRFFHFSGFDPMHPKVLTGYTDDGYLERLDCPALDQLLADHAAALHGARQRAPEPTPYPFAATPDGVPLDPTIRRLARESMKSDERHGRAAALPNPFDEASAPAFVDWLNEAVPAPDGGAPLTRYADGRWRYDDYVRARFGRASAMARWLRHDPSVSPLLADAIPDRGDDMSESTVRELVARAGVDLHEEIDVGSGPWTSVGARRALLRVLAYYEDELRRRDARVVDGLGRAITQLDERMDALERALANIPR